MTLDGESGEVRRGLVVDLEVAAHDLRGGVLLRDEEEKEEEGEEKHFDAAGFSTVWTVGISGAICGQRPPTDCAAVGQREDGIGSVGFRTLGGGQMQVKVGKEKTRSAGENRLVA